MFRQTDTGSPNHAFVLKLEAQIFETGLVDDLDVLPARGVDWPAMLRAASRACATGSGWIALTKYAPVEKSAASVQSPAAKTSAALVRMLKSTMIPPSGPISIPEEFKYSTAGFTPVAQITTSNSRSEPLPRNTFSRPLPSPRLIAVARVEVRISTPFDPHHLSIMALAAGVIMRGTTRSPISTTVSFPLAASASMMMHPMNPAPSCSTLAPGRSELAIDRASRRVQQERTCGRSMPGIGGRVG